jgi:hypothetical protein
MACYRDRRSYAIAELPDEVSLKARLRRSMAGSITPPIGVGGVLVGRIRAFLPPAARSPQGH